MAQTKDLREEAEEEIAKVAISGSSVVTKSGKQKEDMEEDTGEEDVDEESDHGGEDDEVVDK